MDDLSSAERLSEREYRVGDALLVVETFTRNEIVIDAEAVCVDREGLWCVGFQSLRMDGDELLTASRPIHLYIKRETGHGRVVTDSPTQLRVTNRAATETLELDKGDFKMSFDEFDWDAVRKRLP